MSSSSMASPPTLVFETESLLWSWLLFGWISSLWDLPGFAPFPYSRPEVMCALAHVFGATPNLSVRFELRSLCITYMVSILPAERFPCPLIWF